MGVKNALAFDAERLTCAVTASLLTDVTKGVIIHGFEFTEALEHKLKESSALGQHTNVFHFTSDGVTKYLWCQKDYQPWGHRLELQCSKCGVLQPWKVAYTDAGYGVECKNDDCGKGDGSHGTERNSFNIPRPAESGSERRYIMVKTDSRWLKVTIN